MELHAFNTLTAGAFALSKWPSYSCPAPYVGRRIPAE